MMYVTTFYSYKGGVGRTMALVNVATLLAQAGKRVLIADFDLEAPGVPSYGKLDGARGRPGIVDYIHHYLDTATAANAADYVVECPLDDGLAVWVMPAGDNTRASYSDMFASIDWGHLYAHQHGYDLLDNLRQQWASHPARFDYVLIDSRTGNTDIGGICTRQLPDAVVTMFVPTKQNIDGLVPIVDQIRKESAERDSPIDLIFCPSNIPDLFDESDILGDALKEAAKRLHYGSPGELEPPVTLVHHWPNMELLEQPLIVLSRKQSKLAKEFRELMTAVIIQNPADREGALAALERMPDIYEAAREANKGQIRSKILERTGEISRLHDDDGEIAYRAAAVFSAADEYEQEEQALSAAIRADVRNVRARLLRAVARVNLNKKNEALDDIRAVLSSPEGSIFEFGPAVQLLRVMADEPLAEGRAIFLAKSTKLRAKIALAHLLMQDRSNHDLVADEMLSSLTGADVSDEQVGNAENAAMLALIGAGRFQEALDLISDSAVENNAVLFNTAIAEWGASGQVPIDRFEALNERLSSSDDGDQNLHQCLALVRGAVGRTEDALDELDRSEKRISPNGHAFSCWTFTHRTGDEFRADLEEMRKALNERRMLRPPFLDLRR